MVDLPLIPPTTAILLMGGLGERFESALPKQFHRLSGKKIYLHTLEKFIESHLFEEILLVCPLSLEEEIKQDLQCYPSGLIRTVIGGATRQASSFQGILACRTGTELVVIHDAVRPFVSLEVLCENVKSAQHYGATDTCIPSADTLVYAPEKTHINTIPKREEYLRGQTPQSFSYSLILEAHLKAQAAGIENSSDDCSLVLREGNRVHVVKGSEMNLKITTPLDLFLAEQILRLGIPTPKQEAKNTLQGKRYLITGGNGGIGSAIAQSLRKEGAEAISISRKDPHLPTDLTHFLETKTTFETLYHTYGAVDGLINCIGTLKVKELKELSSDEITEQICSNLTAVIFSCKCAIVKEGGHMINIASSSYVKGRKDFTVYSAAKAGVVNFTQGLAEERRELSIHALVPERTNTPLRRENFPLEDPSSLLQPEEIAKEVIALLRSEGSGTITQVRL